MFVNVITPDRPPRTVTRPAAVIVLGMHRSGTSSVAGALVQLGGSAPRHLMAASPDNPRGFWESPVVRALNDDILAAGGSEWWDWRQFDAGRIDAAQANSLHSRARAVLVDEFGDAHFPIVKDPRMCRIMRFWRPVFEDLAWSPHVVLPVRSPLEVARSLRRRDGSDVAMNCLIWMRHVLDAEFDTRGMKRAVLDWSRFLQDWPASVGPLAERLNMRLARGGDGAFSEGDEFLSSKLRRFTISPAELRADSAVTELVLDVYTAMLDLVDGADCVATLRRLDALRRRFEDAAAILDPIIGEERRAARALERANAFINRRILGAQSNPLRRALLARSPRSANSQELSTVRHSPFFDEAFYLDTHPDVRAAGCDTALHYVLYGWREGRDPGPFFSTTSYLIRNPDVAAAGVNPLVHYETHGRKEDRPAIG